MNIDNQWNKENTEDETFHDERNVLLRWNTNLEKEEENRIEGYFCAF